MKHYLILALWTAAGISVGVAAAAYVAKKNANATATA